MKVYLASPLGFAESTRPFMLRLERLLKSAGIDVLNPWRNPPGREFLRARSIRDSELRRGRLRSLNSEVARWNEEAIRSCDAVVAVLDGSDVDSGTASEVGFACALGKAIVGLRTDFRPAGENEAAIVNLQVQHWIECSGGAIATSLKDLEDHITRLAQIVPFPGPQG